MQEDEAKIKFLKKIAKNDNSDIVALFKEVLPYKMEGYSGYTILTQRNVTSSKNVSVQGILNFSKQIYDLWYDYVVSLDESKFDSDVTKKALRIIKMANIYKKENMNPQQCYDFIFKDYQTKFKGSGLRPMWAQSGDEPIYRGQVCPEFIHFTPFLRDKNLTCRLYLNLTPENAVRVGSVLASKCKKFGVKVYGKFWTEGAFRNDGFLVYTTFKNVEKVIAILEEIHREQPKLFEGAEKMNDFVCRINSFIGYGDEPEYRHSSFNEERGAAIDEYFKDLFSNEYKQIGNFSGKIRNSFGENLTLKEYLEYKFKSEFLKSVNDSYNDAVNGNFSDDCQTDERKKAILDFYKKLHKEIQKSVPDYITKQFEYMADMVIERMKMGKGPVTNNIQVKTKNLDIFPEWRQNFEIPKLQKQGYVEYGVHMDFDLKEKLFDVFGSKKKLEKQITKGNIKPYCDKHHISLLHPCLNLESDRCL